ncbi:MAG TPA: hypothetical protein VNW52_10080 [Burkholderiaceae bacterium]|jgi:YVTN family beta-propeller protein|nr:hypothetical protein [Burkholderiaceae bacterium]
MKTYRLIVAATFKSIMLYGLAISCAYATPSNSTPFALTVVAEYALPGKATRWDYMSLDAPRSQLFIAHLGDSAVVVVNTKTKAVIATIDNIGNVHDTLAIPELNRVYASATKTNEVVAIDATTLKVIARMPGGVYPNHIA